ncbi:hypothetical protein R3W88_027107 [Solanum pinnatisectum]|uniref:Uncharacterized protein n=1 Tax=Solanum pinnatisectum TaxID=50273 RepID=A0AAV9LFY5_9SOLN|nr:hypothetical protein R3W88_027107 [Solanum pinnatisectum]
MLPFQSCFFQRTGFSKSCFNQNNGKQQSLFECPTNFTDKNYQIWYVRIKPYFETYVICEVVMEEKPLQPLSANQTKVQIKALSKKLLHKTMSSHVFLKNKIKRRKRKKKKFCKFKNNEKNPTSTTKAKIEEEHFFQLQ